MPLLLRTDHAFGAVFRLSLAVAGLLAVSACHGKRSNAGAAPSASIVHVYGLLPNEPVAAECKKYAQNLLKCVADPRFPPDMRQAQTSALAQMMDRMRFADLAEAERGAAIAGAAEECQAALSTLESSSKVACPGAD
jgi:hypothetical protein